MLKVTKFTNFRGITISPIVSKIFELCILYCLRESLVTSDLQFGFKSTLGCNHALYAVRATVDYYVTNNCTVNVCSLDLTKAFDRVNHFALFLKLMDRNIPRRFILLLHNWYNKSFAMVRWNKCLSVKVKLSVGVRQGGVLSPYLFATLVDDILIKLRKSSLGCRLRGLMFNAIMYSDDLLLLSASLTDLQAMVDLCYKEFSEVALVINLQKSVCLRVGPAHNSSVSNIMINNTALEWRSELCFLGVTFFSSKSVKCNLQSVRQKYFRSLNGLFGKIGAYS